MSPRRRHEEEHENHERWLVSYADFITLMFAFFVVMFASSQSGKMSTKAVSSAVENALQKEMISSKILQAFGQAPKDDKSRSSDSSRGRFHSPSPRSSSPVPVVVAAGSWKWRQKELLAAMTTRSPSSSSKGA